MSRNVFVTCELYYVLIFYTPYSSGHQIEQEGTGDSRGWRRVSRAQSGNLGLATLIYPPPFPGLHPNISDLTGDLFGPPKSAFVSVHS